jgi:NitT/TauT family transport system substrate-binding protein
MSFAMNAKWKSQLAASACVLALSGSAASSKELTEVVVGLPTNININQAIATAAMELGYFEEEGIKVKLQDFQGAAIVIPQVSTKSILIGSGGGDPLVVANQPGKARVPVKFFYNQSRDYIWEFVVPENSPIKTIADIKGKTIGVGSLSNSHMPVTRLIMKENGLELTKDYKVMAISIGGPAFKALMDGQVDVYNTWNANIAGFESFGTKLRRIPISPRFKNLFTVGYFAHEDTIKEKPDILAGFGRGITKGTLTCQVAMDWCVRNFWKYYPNLKPREGSEAENVKRLGYAVEQGSKTFFAFPEGQPRKFAEYPEGAWQGFIDILYEGGEISTNKIDPGTFYTNELVGKINNFDTAAVEKKAATLK